MRRKISKRKPTTSDAQMAHCLKVGFQPGKISNPKGRPVGQEYRACVAYLKSKSLILMQKAVELALAGNPKLLAAFLNKILPDKLDLAIGGEGMKITVEFVRPSDPETIVDLQKLPTVAALRTDLVKLNSERR